MGLELGRQRLEGPGGRGWGVVGGQGRWKGAQRRSCTCLGRGSALAVGAEDVVPKKPPLKAWRRSELGACCRPLVERSSELEHEGWERTDLNPLTGICDVGMKGEGGRGQEWCWVPARASWARKLKAGGQQAHQDQFAPRDCQRFQ